MPVNACVRVSVERARYFIPRARKLKPQNRRKQVAERVARLLLSRA